MSRVKGTAIAQDSFKYLGVPYSKLDCQAFVEECLKDCGIKKNLPGSNAWYREVMTNGWVGSPEDCVRMFGTVPAGAFLFILKFDGGEEERGYHDGLGNASHIGLVTGEDEGAIHSSSSKGKVCQSEFHNKTIPNGGWNQVGLWDFIDYGFDVVIPDDTDSGDDEPVNKATVHSDNGLPVKMRQSPSTSCKYYDEIPNGTIVDLLDWGDTWSKIRWEGKSGYMMSQFLIRGEVYPGTPSEDCPDDMIMVKRSDLLAIYNLLVEYLNCVG